MGRAAIRRARGGGGARALPGLALSPAGLLARWPAQRGLACLWGEPDPAGGGWSRWTVLAEPTECRTWEGLRTRAAVMESLRGLTTPGAGRVEASDAPPFQGGWIGFIGYGVGAVLEPVAREPGQRPMDDRGWPLGAWWRCPGALVHDGLSGRWWAVGDGDELADAANEWRGEDDEGFAIGSLVSCTGEGAFVAAAARVVEYIRAGDIFQANLSHRLTGAFSGSTRALFRALVERARPRHGAYLELPGVGGGAPRAIASASPESFLSFDAGSRLVTTRPMKGTRPASAGAGALEHSGKDRAELAMIVDLMRNDLGRVCEFASMRVAEPRVIERHGAAGAGVFHGVATVQGRLRENLGLADLIGAAFPGGSVTGAPKIRAMQIIEELEPVARGPYCGAIGMVSDSGDAMFNIAIRTALVSHGVLDYSVGAGIVVESDPAAEWAETMDKAGAILDLAGRGR